MNVDNTKFLEGLEEILNMDSGSLSFESSIPDLEGWDSVSALSLIAMIDDSYGVSLEGTEIMRCPTVGDLIALVEHRATNG